MSDMSASVILRLVDDLSGPARKAAASVKNLVKDLEKLKSLTSKSNGAAKSMQGMVRELKKAQTAARELRREMARPAANGFNRAISGIERVRNEARQATRAVAELEGRLRRGGSFDGRVRGGGGGGGGHGGGGGSRGHGGGHGHYFGHAGRHFARHTLGTAAGVGFAALGGEMAESIVESIKSGMEQSFEKAHTKTMLQMQGESAGDIAAAIAQANKMATTLPSFTSAQHLEAIAELRPALLGGLNEATKLAPMFQQSVAILEAAKQGAGGKALGGVNTHGEALDLVRALEIKGETGRFKDDKQNEDNMGRYVDSITKAIVAFNGQIGAKDFHSAFKFARGDASNWSQEFSTEILPTIMNELKKSSKGDASQAGNALKSMSRAVVDNVMTPSAMANWEHLGMYAPGSIKKGKGGKDTVKAGEHMLGYDVFQSNPYQFVQDYLLPHMKDHGIDIGNRKEVVAQLGGLFGNRVANQIAAILATQQAQIKKDQDNIRKATGTSGLNFLQNTDPTTRMHIFAASLRELGGAIGDLALPGVMRGMKGIIDWAHSAAATLQSSPYAKKLSGYYESAMAGIFGQSMGRKGLSGRNGEYYSAGKTLGQGWSHFTSSMGKMFKFAEDIGYFSGAIKVAGHALDFLGSTADVLRGAMEGFRDLLNSDMGKEVVSQVAEVGKGLANALVDITTALLKAFSWILPKDLKDKAGKKFDDKTMPAELGGGTVYALRKSAKDMLPPPSPFGGLGGAKASFAPSVKSMYADVALAAASAMPGIEQSGVGSAAALAAGIQAGGGQATASMTGLMSSLAAIASGGVTVPVKLDTAGAEAQLSGLMAKAGSLRAGGVASSINKSKSLSDTGAPY